VGRGGGMMDKCNLFFIVIGCTLWTGATTQHDTLHWDSYTGGILLMDRQPNTTPHNTLHWDSWRHLVCGQGRQPNTTQPNTTPHNALHWDSYTGGILFVATGQTGGITTRHFIRRMRCSLLRLAALVLLLLLWLLL
jgi:hypothetical protein